MAKKEPEQLKKETDKEGEMVAEAPEADERQLEQAPEASEEEADSAPPELSPEQLVKENEGTAGRVRSVDGGLRQLQEASKQREGRRHPVRKRGALEGYPSDHR